MNGKETNELDTIHLTLGLSLSLVGTSDSHGHEDSHNGEYGDGPHDDSDHNDEAQKLLGRFYSGLGPRFHIVLR